MEPHGQLCLSHGTMSLTANETISEEETPLCSPDHWADAFCLAVSAGYNGDGNCQCVLVQVSQANLVLMRDNYAWLVREECVWVGTSEVFLNMHPTDSNEVWMSGIKMNIPVHTINRLAWQDQGKGNCLFWCLGNRGASPLFPNSSFSSLHPANSLTPFCRMVSTLQRNVMHVLREAGEKCLRPPHLPCLLTDLIISLL